MADNGDAARAEAALRRFFVGAIRMGRPSIPATSLFEDAARFVAALRALVPPVTDAAGLRALVEERARTDATVADRSKLVCACVCVCVCVCVCDDMRRRLRRLRAGAVDGAGRPMRTRAAHH